MKKSILSLIFGLFLAGNLSFAQPNLEALEDHYEDQIEAMGLSEAEEDSLEAQMESDLYNGRTPNLPTVQMDTAAPSEKPHSHPLAQYEHYFDVHFGHCELFGQVMPCNQMIPEMTKLAQNLPLVGTHISEADDLVRLVVWIFIIVLVLAILSFVFWIRMLIDAINHQKESKELWIIALILGNLLAAIIYFFTVRRSRKQTEKEEK